MALGGSGPLGSHDFSSTNLPTKTTGVPLPPPKNHPGPAIPFAKASKRFKVDDKRQPIGDFFQILVGVWSMFLFNSLSQWTLKKKRFELYFPY